MIELSTAQIEYLSSQLLGRIATTGADGKPHVVPTSFRHNAELGTIDIIVQGKQAPVVTLGNGQTLGELGFFHPGKRFAVATARERTQVARIPFDKLARLLTERPALALLFYKNACDFLAKHVRELAIDRDRRYF